MSEQATLAVWRSRAAVLFGEESPAIKFLDEKIAEQGDATVVAADSQLLQALMTIHQTGGDGVPA